jgi:hypothetical protein
MNKKRIVSMVHQAVSLRVIQRIWITKGELQYQGNIMSDWVQQ